MRAFRYTQHISRPREEVFAFMMDFRTAPLWRSLVQRVEVIGGEPLRQGSRIMLTMDAMGKTLQVDSEVWVYKPPHRYGHRNTYGGVTGVFEYVLEPDESGTTVAFIGDLRPHGWMWLGLPFVLRTVRVRYRDQLLALKRAIEEPKR
ncbi:MAG: SRPBCC family protein [Candidatus Sulfotelmatobacter sp.]|jgi:polyketide cyclase/dehydrase/lipid transport protein